ncbi:hypothetical protein BGZ68_001205 [Mortierella alpina]|nr:hypothetical protein BGZ68_001205 [Mortierella alpina]
MDPRRGATTPPVYTAPADSLVLPPLSSLALAPAKELLHRSQSAHSYQEMLLHHPSGDPDHRTPSPLSSASPVSFSPIPLSRFPQEASHPPGALVTPWPRQLPSEQQQRRWDLDRLEDVQRLGHSTRPFTISSAKEELPNGPIDPWARNYSLQTQITLPATTFGSNSIHHLARPVVFDRGSYPHHDFYPTAADASGLKNSGGGADSSRSPLDNHGKFGPLHSLSREGPEDRLEHPVANRDDLSMPRPRSARGAQARYYGDVIEEIEDDPRVSTHQGFSSSHSYLHSYARSRPQREMLHQLDQPSQQHQQQLQLDATPHRHSGSHAYSTAALAESYSAHNQRHNLDHGSLDRISLREGSARTLLEHPSASSLQYQHASQNPHSQNTEHQSHQHQKVNSTLSSRDPAAPSLPPVSSLSTWEPPLSKEHPLSSLESLEKRSSTVDLTSADQSGHPQPPARIERFTGEQKENQVGSHPLDTEAQRPSASMLQRNAHATQPFTIPAFIPGQHTSAQPYRSSHTRQTSQHLAYSSPTPSCPAPSPKYVPPSPEYRPVSPPPSFKQSDADGPQYQPDGRPWANQTHEAQQPSQYTSQQKGSSEHRQGYDNDSDDREGPFRKTSMRSKDLRFKFGTDMPKTVDLKAAIESCDLLCKFALHYASRETRDHRLDPSMVSFEDARDRATLQTIRTLNSTILIGSQNNGRNEDTGKRRRSSLRQPMADESRPMRTKEADVDGPGDMGMDDDDDDDDDDIDDDDADDDDDDDYTQFGNGPPSHEMVHELAKAATSIFQLAIRIKAWVGMTPEERVLDEDINMIRGKRCLFMDGSSMMRMSTLDPHSQQGKEWAMIQAKASSQGMFKTPGVPEHHHQGFKRPNDVDVEMRSADRWDYSAQSTPVGSLTSNAPSFSPMDTPTANMMIDRSKMVLDSSNKTLAANENNGRDGDAPPQKYRKRAKRTQPPGRCLSCDSSVTPEWRRGPDGARTLCNACGLHYAKLLKRQNQQQAKQLQEQQAKQRALQSGDQKVDKMICDLDGMDGDAKKPAGIHLQTIKFQFPRRPVRTLPGDGATTEPTIQDQVEPS